MPSPARSSSRPSAAMSASALRGARGRRRRHDRGARQEVLPAARLGSRRQRRHRGHRVRRHRAHRRARLGARHSTSGSIEVDWAESADLRTTSGRVVVGKCSGMCRVSNKSGKVVVNEAGEGAISSVSGSVHIGARARRGAHGEAARSTCSRAPEARACTRVGSIEVALPPGVKPNVRLGGRARCETTTSRRRRAGRGEDGQRQDRDRRTLMAPAPDARRPRPRPRRSGRDRVHRHRRVHRSSALEGDEQALALRTQEDL